MTHLHAEVKEVKEDETNLTYFNFIQLLKSCNDHMTNLHSEVQEVEKLKLIQLLLTSLHF